MAEPRSAADCDARPPEHAGRVSNPPAPDDRSVLFVSAATSGWAPTVLHRSEREAVSSLNAGQSLGVGQELKSDNGAYSLTLQQDGNSC